MEPKVWDIEKLAIYDPIAAYGILRNSPRIPISFNAAATFSSFAVPQNFVVGNLDSTVAQRTWIDNVEYDLQIPNAFAGSVFKTSFDDNLRRNPGISVQVVVLSGPRYVVSPAFTPINNFTQEFSRRWPAGWPLMKQQSINVNFLLVNPPGGTGSTATPMTCTLTFNGWQFEDWTIDEISTGDARAALIDAGVLDPKFKSIVAPGT